MGYRDYDPGVYAITCLVTGQVYIGSAVRPRMRWAGHRHDLRCRGHSATRLQALWDQHGETAFAFRVEERVPDAAHLKVREQAWIDLMLAGPPGTLLNASPFADRPGVRKSPSPEHRAAISRAMTGYRHTPETRARMSAAAKGKPKGPQSAEHKAKKGFKPGHKLSPEALAKMRASKIGTKVCVGRKYSAETLAKMAESSRRAWAKRKAAQLSTL